jgi:type II secretory pathway predicted ATPase ExeA
MSQQHSNALMQQLKKHFHLVSDPFSMASHFFYEGAQRQHNLETLRHLASFGDMVLFLTGDKGAGKTYLLKKLVDSSFEGLNVIYLDCELLLQSSQKSTSAILKACLRSLGMKEAEGGTTQLLRLLLTECHRLVAVDGVRTLFAFDNADKMPKKELQEYFNFCKELPAESALVMLFSGSSALIQASKLGSNLNQNEWWHQVQLKPFSQIDILPYLEQALTLAGYSEKLQLTENQTQQLVELGKGLPGRINKLFPSVVLEPGLLKIKSKPRSRIVPIWIMLGLAGLLVISFIFVSYQHGLLDRFAPVFSFEDEPLESKPQASESSKVRDRLLEEKNNQQRSRLAMLDGVLKEQGISVPITPENESKSSHIDENLDDVTLKDSLEKQIVEGGILDKNVLPGKEQEEKAPIKKQVEPEEGAQDSDKLESADPPLVIDSIQVKKHVSSSDAPPQKHVHAAFRSKAWLLEQPESSYLAQILGSYSEETAQKFIQKIGKQKFDVYYLETEHKGKPWFVVFYGIFPAKAHAQDAVKNAPKLIRSQNPWIRRSAEVLASYPK